jgi:surfactin synthase thioesterase subunit
MLPGRETRVFEPPFRSFDQLIEAITRELGAELDLPFAIFGHSMGALLAFEWARRLRREGHANPIWLIVSGRCAPHLESNANRLHSLPDQEFIEQLNRLYDGIPDEILRSPEAMEYYLPILRADISVVESYIFREDAPLNCPVTVFAGSTDASVTRDELLAWRRHTTEEFAMRYLPGGHFIPDQPLLSAISATLVSPIGDR